MEKRVKEREGEEKKSDATLDGIFVSLFLIFFSFGGKLQKTLAPCG